MFLCFQAKENEEMRITLDELSNSSSSISSNISKSDISSIRGGGGGGGDDSDLDRDRDGELWCVQDGRVYEQGEDWEVDSCTSCTCRVCVEQI